MDLRGSSPSKGVSVIRFFPLCQAASQNRTFGAPAKVDEGELRMSQMIVGAG